MDVVLRLALFGIVFGTGAAALFALIGLNVWLWRHR